MSPPRLAIEGEPTKLFVQIHEMVLRVYNYSRNIVYSLIYHNNLHPHRFGEQSGTEVSMTTEEEVEREYSKQSTPHNEEALPAKKKRKRQKRKLVKEHD